MSPPAEPTGYATAPLSRLALVALGFNIPCFLPPFTLLAALLGAIALIRIVRGSPARRGAPLAMAAIVLGVTLTIVGTAFWWPGARLMIVGPQDALHAAARGDYDAVRAAFAGAASSASDDQIRRFAELLESRYGPLVKARRDFAEGEPSQADEVWTVPFRLTFEQGSAVARVGIATRDPVTGRSTLRLTSIRIEGDAPVEFPPPRGSPTLRRP